jgi:hypothetical protein
MEVLVIILLILAGVCFGLAAFKTVARWELVPLGLLFWVAAVLIPAIANL